MVKIDLSALKKVSNETINEIIDSEIIDEEDKEIKIQPKKAVKISLKDLNITSSKKVESNIDIVNEKESFEVKSETRDNNISKIKLNIGKELKKEEEKELEVISNLVEVERNNDLEIKSIEEIQEEKNDFIKINDGDSSFQIAQETKIEIFSNYKGSYIETKPLDKKELKEQKRLEELAKKEEKLRQKELKKQEELKLKEQKRLEELAKKEEELRQKELKKQEELKLKEQKRLEELAKKEEELKLKEEQKKTKESKTNLEKYKLGMKKISFLRKKSFLTGITLAFLLVFGVTFLSLNKDYNHNIKSSIIENVGEKTQTNVINNENLNVVKENNLTNIDNAGKSDTINVNNIEMYLLKKYKK